jgi:predicted nuclease of predicted toxin-antitoxin system
LAKLYSNENIPLPVVEALRTSGHDVVTSGRANQAISDKAVLEYARDEQRILLTFNRKHFMKLHRSDQNHAGIIVCTVDLDYNGSAQRIHALLETIDDANGQLFRVNRPV